MKQQLLLGALLLASVQTFAQTEQLGQPVSWKSKVLLTKNKVDMPAVDNAAETAAEHERRANTYEKNLRFGKEQEVNIDFMQQSGVQTLPNGDVLRQLIVHSEGAKSINLIFSQFELASGARLYLFDKNKTEFIGAHTSLNNNASRMLGTELIHSDELVIELVEPAAVAGQSTLVIGTVVHGYIDLDAELKALNDSGDCMYDVNCPIGSGWENQRNSVAMMVNGGGFCTGSLVNNTSGTIIPYFISANHCGTTPGSWVFRFRWESPAAQADCATPANSVNGPTNMNVNGGILRAAWSGSDFTLIELNTAPNPAWGVYYSGWDRSDIPSPNGTGIHHPSGDIKKISFDYSTLQNSQWAGTPANSHWRNPNWDEGVTEGGSSGSPLYDNNHRFVGQLHGGASSCGNSPGNLWDDYGKFSFSWTGNNSNSTRLSNWLDPGNTGVITLDGVDPSGPGVALDASTGNLQGVSGTLCGGTVTPSVTITNNGSTALTSATINYGYDGVINQTYNWTGNLSQYQNATITLPSATLAGGAHTFEANVSAANGSTDENVGNNVSSSSFTTVVGGQNVDFALTLDCFGSETTWEIQDTVSNAMIYSGGPYEDDEEGMVISGSYCLNAGCYRMVIFDSFGDGFSPSQWCSEGGSYTLTDDDNVEVAGLTVAEGNFGEEDVQVFCVGIAGMEELNAHQQLWSVYPNPASQVLNVEMSSIDGTKEITVMNATGQIVSTLTSVQGQASIAVSDLSKGVYFIRLNSAGGVTTKTFVVK